MASISCLCLGPKNSGKTHLLNSLQSPGSINNVSQFVPTVGTNIFRIKLTPSTKSTANDSNSSATCSKQKKMAASVSRQSKNQRLTEINILEIGGEMAPMWTSYLCNVKKIIYVVDTSNLCQISAAGELWLFINDTIYISIRKKVFFFILFSGILAWNTRDFFSFSPKWISLIDKCETRRC